MSSPDTQLSGRLSRRDVLKFFAAAAAYAALPAGLRGQGAPVVPPAGEGGIAEVPAGLKGYGTDPQVNRFYQPGDVWPLTLTAAQRETVRALADLIFPEDPLGPSAGSLRVHDYIDEWVSAPYEEQRLDRAVILRGIAWLDTEAGRGFGHPFAHIDDAAKRRIVDPICWLPDAAPEARFAAEFFHRFRELAACAYYGTPAGWQAIGYIGNVPSLNYEGPPAALLAKLGLVQPHP